MSKPGSPGDSTLDDSLLQKIAGGSSPLPAAGETMGGEDGGRFEIQARIGTGSIGTVFRAMDRLLERVVAIKLLRLARVATPGAAIDLFLTEARAIAKLNHENIIRLFDAGRWCDQPYLVIEYLGGRALYSFLARDAFTPRRAVRIMLQVLEGLAHAHANRIVHRDLKPNNVFLFADDRIKILDFGLAHVAAAAGDVPLLPEAGTPAYMAPEQWRGGAQDHRVDLWAAGVMLFEMLTGEPPFQGRTTAELRQLVTSGDPAPSVLQWSPDLPSGAEDLLARALAKQPQLRFQTAAQMREALLALDAVLGEPARGRRRAPQVRQVSVPQGRVPPSPAGPSGGVAEAPPGYVSLRAFQGGRRLDAVTFCRLAIRCTASLGQLHRAGAVHLAVSPSHLFVRPGTLEVRLMEPGAAPSLSREPGALAYLSPEQTGRMNRGVDDRSDLYSLGACFYELLVGRPPFEAAEPVDLIYAHIARQPRPPVELAPELPGALWAIVMRLLAKMAEDRYQSCHGLEADLRSCLGHLERDGRVPDFPLGGDDFSTHFSIPQKLYGRDAERGALMAAFERVAAGGAEALFMAGPSGIGKSALAGELHRPITGRHGSFACGKFDQLNRNIPYQAFIQAFQDVTRKILTEGPQDLESWRSRLLEALAPNAQILVDAVPQLQLLLGAQPPVVPLGPGQSEIRFNLLFRQLVRTLATREHPLVIFLDDLQWSDDASLNLIRSLSADPDLSHFLLIGAYRDDEVHRGHPLAKLIAELKQARVKAEVMSLAPMDPAEITNLLSDALHTSADGARALAELVADKTGGNPFFISQYLGTLHRQRLVEPAPEERRWRWDLDRIRREAVTDDVIDLIAARLQSLGEGARRIAQVAACLGSTFDLRTISPACRPAIADPAGGLQELLNEELIVSAGDAYAFLHDRIRQAAYLSIAPEDRSLLHRRLGRLLLEDAGEQRLEERLFDIVTHLNGAGSLVERPEERHQLAGLNLRAGRKAKRSGAHEPAMRYLAAGLSLLGEDGWREQQALAFDLHVETAEAAYLTGRYDDLERLAGLALGHAASPLQEIQALEVRLNCYSARAQWERALDVAHEALEVAGAPLPRRPGKEDSARAIADLEAALRGRDQEDLRRLPEVSDPTVRATMRILLRLLTAAFASEPNAFPLVVCKMVQLTIRHGLTSGSAHAFVTYAMLLCRQRAYAEGVRFGKLAVEMLERLPADGGKGTVLYIFNVFIRPWKEPLADTIQAFIDVAQVCLETGNLEFFSYAHMDACRVALACGRGFDWLRAQLRHSLKEVGKHQLLVKATLDMLAVHHLVDELQGAGRRDPIEGDRSDQEMMEYWLRAKDYNSIGFAHGYRGVARYFAGDPGGSLGSFERCDELIEALEPGSEIPFFQLYEALARLALAAEQSGEKRDRLLARVEAIRGSFKEWAGLAPANFAHRLHLLDAERARVLGTGESAEPLYERAVELARENGFLNDQALAHELAGRFYLARSLRTPARAHLSEAWHLYRQWGAGARAALLRASYPELLERVDASADEPPAAPVSGADVGAVVRTAEAICSELVLGNLLEKLIDIAMRNVGARRGALLLERGGVPVLVAEAGERGPALPRLPGAIVNYCFRTREPVLLGDATKEGPFVGDPYVTACKPRSLLCTPLVHQGKAIGLIYLENDLAAGAFNPDGVRMVQQLSGMASIALKNAERYAALERFVPHQLLRSIEGQAGEGIRRESSILVSGIRDFTGLAEGLASGIFTFLNQYLGYLEPPILEAGGFIHDFTGGGFMAFFERSADSAVQGAIAVRRALERYNEERRQRGERPIATGIGIDTGSVLLGTIGRASWLRGGVLGGAVGLAARVEGLTGTYGASILMTEHTHRRLEDPSRYSIRQVEAKEPVALFEVLDGG